MSQQIDVLKLDDRIKDALLALLDSVEKEDEYVRLQHMRQYKKNNLFWHGFQYLFWSDSNQDWRIPTHEEFEEISGREETRYIFDYVVNVFKAHGESIIAALSADIPDVRFGPRDAQDPDDHRAVEAADNCVELIQKWNRAKLVIINALFYLSTEGFVASYTYNKKDPTFGQVNIPQYGSEMKKVSPDQYVCESCGYGEEVPEEAGIGSSDPTDIEAQEGNVHTANKPCPHCGGGMMVDEAQPEEIPVLQDNRLIAKGREIIEVYGALSVRVPSYVSKQADAGYLIHYVDADPAVFKDAFPDLREEIGSTSEDSYERTMRATSLTSEGMNVGIKLTTQKKCWMRPWMINRLDKLDDDVLAALRDMFKSGIYFSAINRVVCEVRDESMDRHWTITKAGPSKGVHADPLLQSIVPLQEVHNNLVNLFVMQVEYGVPATYADSEVFDFAGQAKQEVAPGHIYPVTPRPGQSISDGFYTEKTTSLSKEATQLLNMLEQLEQFCTGSFPSIYGGPSVSGSKTLGEYDRSRNFALQRLSLVWYFINVWWGETIHKSLLSFIDHQIEDEPLTTQTSHGWQTKWIRVADLKGSFDRLEPDVSSDFPSSFAQKRSLLMQLFQLGNPMIEQVLFSPENAGLIKSYLGLNELKIPMSSQRIKQMREILQLIGFEPQVINQGQVLSTVPVEPDIDDHEVHIAVITEFLVSDAGQDLKENDMASYANALAHLMEHKMAMQAMMAPGLPPVGPPGAPQPNAPPPGVSPGGAVPPATPQPPTKKVNGAAHV